MPTEGAAASSEDLRAVGDRIEVLLEASSSVGFVQRERAEELVGLVTNLYGSGLERILEVLHDRGQLDEELLAAFANDDLVSSLLLVHGLHPHTVEQRVEAALTKVRPYLGSHGGDVELLGVDDEGVVRLRLLGSCDGCPSSAVTLQLAVEGAVEEAAPEITGIDVETPTAEPAGPAVFSIDSLRSRIGDLDSAGGVEWTAMRELGSMVSGEVSGFSLGSFDVFACAVDDHRFVYRDVCPRCASSLAGTTMAGSGDRISVACPTCKTGYDVRRAGTNIAGGPEHLDPLPTLHTGGIWQVAVPVPVSA